MWSFHNRRNALHEHLLLAPESNPSEFVRRYLAQKDRKEKAVRYLGASQLNKIEPGGSNKQTPTQGLSAG